MGVVVTRIKITKILDNFRCEIWDELLKIQFWKDSLGQFRMHWDIRL